MSDPNFGQGCPARGARLPLVTNFEAESLATFLRKRHPFDTAFSAGQRADIPAETVRNWLKLRARPSVDNWLRLARAYGPAIVAACWRAAPAWLSPAVQEVRAAEIEAEISRLSHELEAIRQRERT